MSPRVGLTRAAVVQAAAALADDEGVGEALSLARLAERLGVRTPSLYNHVGGVADLKRELALTGLRGLGQSLASAAAGRAGEEGYFALAAAYRRFIMQRPGLYAETVTSPRLYAPDDPELREAEGAALEPVMAVLASLGVTGEDAIHAARGLRSVAHGFATLQQSGGLGMQVDPDESFRRLVHAVVHALGDKYDRTL